MGLRLPSALTILEEESHRLAERKDAACAMRWTVNMPGYDTGPRYRQVARVDRPGGRYKVRERRREGGSVPKLGKLLV